MKLTIAKLKPHPENFRSHPDDQLEHIARSLEDNGQYRPVVVAKDGTILAGHGLVEAAKLLGWEKVDAVRLDLEPDDPKARKILVGDNTVSHLAEDDDRQLSELLKGLADLDSLLGTGYDESMLANLVLVTRPSSEIGDTDVAAEWVGMPEFVPGEGAAARIIVNFDSKEDRDRFVKETGVYVLRGESAWWPPRKPQDLSSIAVEG